MQYSISGTRYGLPLMFIAGAPSGWLGIGSGVQVSAMDISMELPMKVSYALSNSMIGATAAAAGVRICFCATRLFRSSVRP